LGSTKLALRVVCLVLVATCIGSGAAAAAEGRASRPPTTLWNAFPLEQSVVKESTVPAEALRIRLSPPPARVPPADISAAPLPADQGNGGRLPLWFPVTLIGATGIALVLAAARRHAPATLHRDATPRAKQARESGRDSPFARVAAYGRPSIDHDREQRVRFRELDVAGRIEAAKLIRELILKAEAHSQAPPKLRLVESVRALETPAATDVCSIRVWQGYLKSRFLAMPLAAAPRAETIAESPAFRAAGADVPERTPESARALAELLCRLDELGWSTVSEGPQWFDRRLAWTPPADEGDAA